MTTTRESNEITIIRLYDAPLALVWDAWTKEEHVGQWWGPRGFTITTKSKDLRAGGTWEYTMHGPDGKDWPNFTRYHEVVPRQRLVYDHGATSADAAPMFRVTALFREVGGKTELNMTMAFATVAAAQESRVFIKAAGGNGTWDRLAEFLEEQVTKKEIFVINRSFEAPIETVFDMWTKPEHVAQWSAPTGFTMTFHEVDIRPGGSGFYSMTNGQFTMWGRAEYLDVRAPDLLRYTQSFADEHGNMSRHPAAPVWPEKMLTTVTFASEGPATTRVTLRWEPFGAATPAEIAAFVKERAGMTGGWTGSFDKLETLLAGVPAA
jgi:uncharacterized protein YndB with AHSA1/START domain